MIVCVCRRVSDKEIRHQASLGLGFDDIQFELGVASQCGQCEGCARELISQCHTQAACSFQPITLQGMRLRSV